MPSFCSISLGSPLSYNLCPSLGKHLDALRALRTASRLAPHTPSDLEPLTSRLSEAVKEMPESPLRSALQAELSDSEEEALKEKVNGISLK